MIPILILAGLAGFYILIEKQNQAIAALGSRSSSSGGSSYRGPSLADQFASIGSGGLSTGQQVTGDIAMAGGIFGSLASSGALGAGLQAAKAVPIIGSVIGIATSILGGIFAAHAKKVKEEAATLDAAVPRWRALMKAIQDSYNSADVGAADAITFIAKAKEMYYAQVQSIERGDPGKGAPVSGYFSYTGSHPGTPPVDPCNGACYIGYYWIEPEAQIIAAAIQQAEQTGKPVGVSLKSFTVRNGLVQPSINLVFARPR